MAVVMAGIDAKHVLELAAAEDEQPVEALATDAADPALGVGVRVRRLHGCADHGDPFASENLIEAAAAYKGMETAAFVRELVMEQRRQGATAPPLPDMLDRASQRMTERAQRMQAFAGVFKPFYEGLSEEQKAVAGIVLRDMRGGMRGHGRRWAMGNHMRRGPGGPGPSGAEQPAR